MAEQPLEPPPNALPRHAKGLVDLLAIGSLENHVAGPAGLQFNPQVLRLHQLSQVLQECLVLLG